MSEFFKQLIAQLAAVWSRLSTQQKVVTTSLVLFTFLGLTGLMLFANRAPSASGGMRILYSDLDVSEVAAMTDILRGGRYSYELENDGRTVKVRGRDLYEIRMALAREGLPKSRGIGYELFDKTNLGMTDFVQRLNALRALQGELQRTIEGLDEIRTARVHIVIPEKTIFLDERQSPKASVVIQPRPGVTLSKAQIRGITHLLASSVDGLEGGNISIVNQDGKLLSSPFGHDETALAGSRNLELQQNVERYLEIKAQQILNGVVGPGKSNVKIAADLDFDRVERTLESYDPESRVIRSEERSDENTKNAPDGDHQRERSLTNFEINKQVEHVVAQVGNIRRLTVSVVVDGRYEPGEEGEERYVPRNQQFMFDMENLVKNAVGYDLARGDQISVANVQFDNDFMRHERDAMLREERRQQILEYIKYGILAVVIIMFLLFLRYFAATLAEAMNPPVPRIAALGVPEEVPEEVPEDMRRTSEILERVEMLTREEPINIASIIKQWLAEPSQAAKKK